MFNKRISKSTFQSAGSNHFLMYVFITLVTLIVCSSNSKPLKAEEFKGQKPETAWQFAIAARVTLDGLTYSHENLIQGFLTAAFASIDDNTIRGMPLALYSDSPMRTKQWNNFPSLAPARLKAEYPWLYEYVYRENGDPKRFAINKWKKPITISIGYPNDLAPFEPVKDVYQPSVGGSTREYPNTSTVYCCASPIDKAVEEKVEKALNIFIPVMQEATSLPVEYIRHEDETTTRFGSIRIILETGNKPVFTPPRTNTTFKDADKGWKDAQSSDELNGGEFGPVDRRTMGFHDLIRKYFLNGIVAFTPNFPYGVDGFFAPNEKNEIEESFCFISEKLNKDAFQAAIGECLIRSLGFPESSAPFNQGRSATYKFLNLSLNPQPGRYPYLDIPGRYTDFDVYMMKLLYSPEIMTGTSFTQTLKTLSGNFAK